MANTLLLAFEEYPRERELISRMILAYGELEFVMLDILTAIFQNAQMAVRTLYQLRSESNRLAITEAIATPWFEKVKLGGQFREGINAAHHCKAIRNQYAHCTWVDVGGLLRFANLEETAKSKGAKCEVRAQPITLSTLERQSAYFDYTDQMLLWLNHTYRIKTGLQSHVDGAVSKPRRVPPPKLNSRGEGQSRR